MWDPSGVGGGGSGAESTVVHHRDAGASPPRAAPETAGWEPALPAGTEGERAGGPAGIDPASVP